MALVAGAGFGGEIFRQFMEANQERFTMLAVTLPGFGDTQAPPMPAADTSYSEQTWTRAAAEGVIRLLETEHLDNPVIVGHWLNGTQVALEVALMRGDLVRAVVILSGVSKFMPIGAGMPELQTPEMRAMMVDRYLAPQWFKTVTRETWDDNNFLPRDYAIHPLRGLQLWKEAARPTLPVWIRYLCEVWARDSTLDLDRLQVPLLLVQPVFDDLYHQGPQTGADYMQAFLHGSWEGVESGGLIRVQSVQDSRVFLMDDQPEVLDEVLSGFLDEVASMQARRAEERPGRSRGRSAPDPASSPPDPGYWNGDVSRDGERHILAGGTVSLALPDPSWELETVVRQAPVVARIHDAQREASITLQIQPSFGYDLDQLPQMLEAQLQANYATYEVLSHGRTTLAGKGAIRFHCAYHDDGAEMRLHVILVPLRDDYLFSASFRAPNALFETLAGDFGEIERSLLLEAE